MGDLTYGLALKGPLKKERKKHSGKAESDPPRRVKLLRANIVVH